MRMRRLFYFKLCSEITRENRQLPICTIIKNVFPAGSSVFLQNLQKIKLNKTFF